MIITLQNFEVFRKQRDYDIVKAELGEILYLLQCLNQELTNNKYRMSMQKKYILRSNIVETQKIATLYRTLVYDTERQLQVEVNKLNSFCLQIR